MMHQGRGQWWENPELVKEIGLTEAQVKKIDGMATAHRKEMIKTEADLKIAKLELQDLFDNMENETPSERRPRRFQNYRRRSTTARIEHRLAMHKVLTAEQQKKMKSLRPMKMKKIIINDNCED